LDLSDNTDVGFCQNDWFSILFEGLALSAISQALRHNDTLQVLDISFHTNLTQVGFLEL
jgi:hypothetical protein